MRVDLQPGESRGSKIQIYGLNPQIMRLLRRSRFLAISWSTVCQRPWIYYRENIVTTGSIIRQGKMAKITGKIHNEKAILLLDTGTEVSIVDTAFARKVGCYIDSSQIQDCVGIGAGQKEEPGSM
ncbi:hypothetical protein PHMEG_00024510 [Phytophthora megakarya]|uniref:Peptidase A2 domain-containing protein n=1 Tax=Phytophthora megakarya TaxID=4795 RepID=A0A225VGU8_9STRA|nr:hypothetical protein PHMEG_00024510 [Phytophthora megakarya]